MGNWPIMRTWAQGLRKGTPDHSTLDGTELLPLVTASNRINPTKMAVADVVRNSDLPNRLISLAATTLTIDADTHGERIVLLNHTGAASTVTLPAATATGNVYTFIVGAVNTSNHVIKCAGTDAYEGMAIMCNDSDASVSGFETAAADDTITLNGTTKGGAAIGDKIVLIDYATGKWNVLAHLTGSGTEATPFSTS